MIEAPENVLGVLIGIGLSAACGMRAFIPMLGTNLAAMFGYVTLTEQLAWLASPTATVVLGAAAVVEVAAYYIPWVDNLLDSLATPLAMAAGTLLTGALLHDLPPALHWGLAAIAGGSTSGLVQGSTVLLRGASTASTGGLANPLVATGEWAGATVTTVLAILVPVAVIIGLVAFGVVLLRRRGKRRAARS